MACLNSSQKADLDLIIYLLATQQCRQPPYHVHPWCMQKQQKSVKKNSISHATHLCSLNFLGYMCQTDTRAAPEGEIRGEVGLKGVKIYPLR